MGVGQGEMGSGVLRLEGMVDILSPLWQGGKKQGWTGGPYR